MPFTVSLPKRLTDRLQQTLDQRQADGLRRSLSPLPAPGPTVTHQNQTLLNAASNDYLGHAQHPTLKQAAADAALTLGTGATASRLVAGHLTAHDKLEARFAAFKHAEAALLFPTGYTANLAVLGTLTQPGDTVFHDKLNHASLLDASRIDRVTTRTFPHRDYAALDRKLDKAHQQRAPDAELFIVTDAVFSMDGTTADLPALLEIADRYHATLIVDEAHATGVLGPTGAGLAEAQHVAGQIPITISTASKALGSLGGLVTSSQLVIDTLINTARPFIYSTGVPPTQIAAIGAALDVLQTEPHHPQRLAEITHRVLDAIPQDLLPFSAKPKHPTPIIPLITGTPESALALAARLRDLSVFAPAIRPPTVAPSTARVRLSLRADWTDTQVDQLLSALHQALPVTA
ncbi:MAG: 8-amino-7-oxononanoate synthase [Planctomycetota bacterium]